MGEGVAGTVGNNTVAMGDCPSTLAIGAVAGGIVVVVAPVGPVGPGVSSILGIPAASLGVGGTTLGIPASLLSSADANDTLAGGAFGANPGGGSSGWVRDGHGGDGTGIVYWAASDCNPPVIVEMMAEVSELVFTHPEASVGNRRHATVKSCTAANSSS